MKFNIARQPLIPAFLTLAALAVIAMWCVRTHPGSSARPGEGTGTVAETGLDASDTLAATDTFAAGRNSSRVNSDAESHSPEAPAAAGRNIADTPPAGRNNSGINAAAERNTPEAVAIASRNAADTPPAGRNIPQALAAAGRDSAAAGTDRSTNAADAGPNGAQTLVVSSPGELLARFQAAFPGWSRWIGGLLILFTGMCAGRLTVRYNLYSVNTCLAIPLFAAIACGLALDGEYLTTFTASALLALVLKNYARSCCNGFGFDAIFRASLYLGLLPLVTPASLPLILLLPLSALLFRRTLREVAVATAGVLLPALTLCYVNWGAGGGFPAPLAAMGQAFLAGEPLALFSAMPMQNLALMGGILLLDAVALLFFLSDIYALGTKARFVFIFNISILVLTAALLCGPAATPGLIALVAVPSAVLLPFLFVRIHRGIALILYLLLLASAVIGAVLQYSI